MKSRKIVFYMILILIISVSFTYFEGIFSEPHLDDYPNIFENSNIKIQNITCESIKNSAIFYGKITRPLSYISFAINYLISGDEVWSYHLFNILLHILTSIIIFRISWLLLSIAQCKVFEKYDILIISFLSTLLWALHPLHVSSVNYIVQRMALLTAFFHLLGILFYIEGRLLTGKNYKKYLLYFLCGISGLLSFLSKQNGILIIPSILLIEFILFSSNRNFNLKNIKSKKTFLVILTVSLLLTAVIVKEYVGLSFDRILSGYSNLNYTMTERLLTQPRIILFYISLILYPISDRFALCHEIDISKSIVDPINTALSLFIIILMIWASVKYRKKWPLLTFAILFYFSNHLVESTFLPLELVFEHRNYISSSFLFLGLLSSIWIYFRTNTISRYWYFIVMVLIALLCIFNIIQSTKRVDVFKSELSLWRFQVDRYPDSMRSNNNLADEYMKSGEYDKVKYYFMMAEKSKKFQKYRTKARLYTNIAIYLVKVENNIPKAVEYLIKSMDIDPSYVDTIRFICQLFNFTGEYEKAQKIIYTYYNEKPKNVYYYNTLSISNFLLNKFDIANTIIEQGLKKYPYDYVLNLVAGEICRRDENYEKSVDYFNRCIVVNPDGYQAYMALFSIYDIMHNDEEKELYDQFCEIVSNDKENNKKYLKNGEIEIVSYKNIEKKYQEKVSLCLKDCQ